MSRTLHVTLDLTVADNADDETVTDFVFDLVCGGGDVEADAIPYETCDGSDWKRAPLDR